MTPASRLRNGADTLDRIACMGELRLLASYQPPLSCREHLLRDLPTALPLVYDIGFITRQCVNISTSCLARLPAGVLRLSADQALAIAAFSYDLGINSEANGADNLFVQLNEALRRRNGPVMLQLKPFLSFLMRGLAALPAVAATVFRGIPAAALATIQRLYLEGAPVHWSAFSSTTLSLGKAKEFAQGPGGIILRIRIQTGRNIVAYSAIPEEDEILLSPNCKLVVTGLCRLEADRYYYLDMVEVREEGVVY